MVDAINEAWTERNTKTVFCFARSVSPVSLFSIAFFLQLFEWSIMAFFVEHRLALTCLRLFLEVRLALKRWLKFNMSILPLVASYCWFRWFYSFLTRFVYFAVAFIKLLKFLYNIHSRIDMSSLLHRRFRKRSGSLLYTSVPPPFSWSA